MAAEHSLGTDSGPAGWGHTEFVTVHDHGRTVLLYDDVNGIAVGGYSA